MDERCACIQQFPPTPTIGPHLYYTREAWRISGKSSIQQGRQRRTSFIHAWASEGLGRSSVVSLLWAWKEQEIVRPRAAGTSAPSIGSGERNEKKRKEIRLPGRQISTQTDRTSWRCSERERREKERNPPAPSFLPLRCPCPKGLSLPLCPWFPLLSPPLLSAAKLPASICPVFLPCTFCMPWSPLPRRFTPRQDHRVSSNLFS